MALRVLIVSHDTSLEAAFCRACGETQLQPEFCADATSATKTLDVSHFDIVVVDCDDVYGGAFLLKSVRQSLPNKSSLLLAITNGETNAADAVDLGANFVVAKPLSPDRVRFELRRAYTTLNGDHRTSRRYPVSIPVFVSFGDVLDRRANAVNVSAGGMGLRVPERLDCDEVVHLRFQLPGAEPIQARGEIAWADQEGNAGIRFVGMAESALATLISWLNRSALSFPASAAHA